MPTDQTELSPYVGPRPFERTKQDRARFFGRDRETQEIMSLIVSQPLVLVYAQSGAGKTSLFNAKVTPALEDSGFEVLPLTRVRGAMPEGVKPQDITNLYVFNALLNLESKAAPQTLVDKSLAKFLEERPRTTDAGGRPVPRAIIFDQFEEIFTLHPERWYEQQEAFFHQVAEALAADPLLRVSFVIREEYLARLDPFARLLPERLRTRFRLERLRQGAALAAIKGPLVDKERSFAEGVAEQLVEELLKVRVETATGETKVVTGEFVEPVQLQVVCQSLWRDLPPDVAVITQDHLQTFGDVNQALSEFYERSIKRATQEPGVREGALRGWFERVLITPAGTRGMVYRGRKKTGRIRNAAVDVLESLHLIRQEWRAGARWYELTHDRFIGPIQTSNEAWRRGRRLRIGGAVAAVLILLLVGIAARLTTEATQTAQQATAVIAEVRGESETTATAAAVQVSGAEATVVVAEAIATAAAAEAAKADYVHQGSAYAEQGDYEKALAAYNEAINLYPDYAQAYYSRGLAYGKLGEYEDAIADYTQAIELNFDPLSWPYNSRGDAYHRLGNDDQAIADFDKAIELDPNYALAYYNRGVIYGGRGDYEQAIADYTQAIELNPNDAKSYNNRGLVYVALDDYKQAIADYTQAIELNPNDAKALANRAWAYDKLGDYDQAIADYTKAGDAYREMGSYDQAITNYTRAIELDPDYASAYSNRGLTYSKLGDYKQAIADYNQAIELDPDYATAYYNRGLAYRKLDNYEQAIADYTKAIELNYDPLSWPYNSRGNAYRDLGKYPQAIADFSKAIELDPDKAMYYNNRGLTYADLGDYEQATADYNQAIELDPNYARAHLARGIAYADLGDYDQAITDYTEAIDLNHDPLSWPYYYRGLAYSKLQNYEQAIADYTTAIELDPDYASAYDNRGWAYSQLEDYTRAFQDFEKSIELNPDNPWVYYYRGLTYADQGDTENAIADLEMALQLSEPPLDEKALNVARTTLDRLQGQ